MHSQHQEPPIRAGSLLLASPVLCDGIFERSVVLLTSYQPGRGASGFILNKKTKYAIGDVSDDNALPPELQSLPVYMGGPVDQDTLLFAAFSSVNGKLKFDSPLSAEQVNLLIEQPGTAIRAFAGYSSWYENQLEDEMNEFMWLRTTATPAILDIDENKCLWKETLRGISAYHAILAEAPQKPFLN